MRALRAAAVIALGSLLAYFAARGVYADSGSLLLELLIIPAAAINGWFVGRGLAR